MVAFRSCGQATVEFVFILAFGLFLGGKLTGKFADFFSVRAGSVGHILSRHLTVGICPRNCFFDNYKNGFTN